MELLWSKRFNAYINDRIFLLRRLANGFAFLPVLIFLLGLYYYPQFIEWLPISFPVKLAFALIIAWVVTRGNYRSFLQSADTVYLIPIEKGLSPYFRRCFYYNVILQSFLVLSTLVVLSPLFFARVLSSMNDFIVVVIIMLLLKAWNVFVQWQTLKIEASPFFTIRLALNFLFIYGLLLKHALILMSIVVLSGVFYWGLLQFRKTNRIDWIRLTENEQRLDARFYTWIGSFVDHPYVVSKIKHNKLLAKVIDGLKKKPANAYHYLYLKMFIRTDVLGIILRILIIGIVMLWLIPNIYFLLGAYTVLIFIIGLQIHSFWHTFRNQFWANLYPLTEANRNQAYLSSSFYVLLVVAFILLIPVLVKHFTFSIFAINIIIAFAIPYSVIYLYLGKKIRH